MASNRKSLTGNPNWCSICGLRIPEEIANHNHPLFGTIDHVVPKYHGGPDNHANRAPAHKYCNRRKGHNIALEYDVVCAIQVEIIRRLMATGATGKSIDVAAARKRIGLIAPAVAAQGASPYALGLRRLSAMQWEDDGGTVASL